MISFGPCLSDRRYIVLKSRDLVNWSPLPDDTVGGGVGGEAGTFAHCRLGRHVAARAQVFGQHALHEIVEVEPRNVAHALP